MIRIPVAMTRTTGDMCSPRKYQSIDSSGLKLITNKERKLFVACTIIEGKTEFVLQARKPKIIPVMKIWIAQ